MECLSAAKSFDDADLFGCLDAVALRVVLVHSTGHSFNRMSRLRPDLTAARLAML